MPRRKTSAIDRAIDTIRELDMVGAHELAVRLVTEARKPAVALDERVIKTADGVKITTGNVNAGHWAVFHFVMSMVTVADQHRFSTARMHNIETAHNGTRNRKGKIDPQIIATLKRAKSIKRKNPDRPWKRIAADVGTTVKNLSNWRRRHKQI